MLDRGATREMSENPRSGVRRWIDRQDFLLFDLETTGIDVVSDLPVSVALAKMSGEICVRQRYEVINPGIDIPEGAYRVHQISNQLASERGTALEDAISFIVSELMDASATQTLIVGMNLCYDLTLIDNAARRILGTGLIERGFDAPVLDVLVLDREFERRRPGKRTLARLCEEYLVNPSNLHNALADAFAAFEVLKQIMARYPLIIEIPPRDLNPRLEEFHHNWARGYNEWRSREGLPPIPIWSWPIQSRLI